MISNDCHPKGREDLHKEDLEDGCALSDPKTYRVYTSNTTATLVWEYCDENHTLKQIAGEDTLAGELTVDEVLEDVRNIILDFQNKKLLSLPSYLINMNIPQKYYEIQSFRLSLIDAAEL
jgi:hypothetical protein